MAGSESSWQQGPEPFREDYTYQPNELANLASVATDGGAAQTYGYGDAAHRGAVTAVGARSFGYDGAGRMTTRTLVAGASETLTWNPDSTLASETRAAGSSSYVYDANGQRVIRREGGVDTLYLPGVEVARTVATGVAKATRYYGAGGLVASRTAVGVQWVLGDHQGSVAGASPDGSTVASPKRYRPFGQQRGVDGTGLERGFLGQTGDSASGLSYLNARYYDAALKRFITPDPVSTPENPLNFSAYAYSHNNPTTLSDPSGLSVPECGHSCGTTYGNGRPINRPHGPSRYDKPNSAGGSARMSVAGRVSSSASPSARKVKEKLEADTTWGEDFLRLGVSTVAGFACGAVGGSVLGPAGADVAGGVCGGIVDRLVSHLQRGGSFAGAIDVAFDAKAILADGLTGAAFGKLLKVFGPKLVSLVEEFFPGAAKALSGFLGLRKSSATNSAGLADDLAGVSQLRPPYRSAYGRRHPQTDW
ncbi:MAG: RHS repeat-associated core domain-containing protein [Actinobacteria bacterium]|nr:RHS repeat-associated core domain-containing protein [Actinomycetota bacterium]